MKRLLSTAGVMWLLAGPAGDGILRCDGRFGSGQ